MTGTPDARITSRPRQVAWVVVFLVCTVASLALLAQPHAVGRALAVILWIASCAPLWSGWVEFAGRVTVPLAHFVAAVWFPQSLLREVLDAPRIAATVLGWLVGFGVLCTVDRAWVRRVRAEP